MKIDRQKRIVTIDRKEFIIRARNIGLKWRIIAGVLDRSITTVRDIYFNNRTSKEKKFFFVRDKRIAKLNIIGIHTDLDWEKLKKQYNYMCLCCKKFEPEIRLVRDHIIPLIRGGSNYIENIQPLCYLFNSKKFIKKTDFNSD